MLVCTVINGFDEQDFVVMVFFYFIAKFAFHCEVEMLGITFQKN